MSQKEKSALWQYLKDAGVKPEGHFRDYTTEDLREAVRRLQESAPKQARQAGPEVRHRKPNELAGERLNTHSEEEPLRVDPDTGFIWYQEEVRKPHGAAPRARRKLQYVDTGTKVHQVFENGALSESFEIPGEKREVLEARITMPSYQVGIYQDPRTRPFRTVIYNGRRGFHYDDVNKYFGGVDLVPSTVKRQYVSNVLCYNIRSVVDTINDAYRTQQLSNIASK